MKRNSIFHYFYMIYGLLFVLFLINVFVESVVLTYIVGVFAVMIVPLAWYRASRLFKLIGALFFLTGASMSISSGIAWYEIPLQVTNTVPMLLFLSVLPWMAMAFRIGGYDERLSEMMHTDSNKLSSIYGKSLMTTYALLIFINMSAMYVSQNILKEKLKGVPQKIAESFVIQTTVRAFALAILWSPMEVIVGIAVDATGVSYFAYLPWLLLISFIAVTLDILISRRKYDRVLIEQEPISFSKKFIFKEISKLLVVLVLFLATIVVVNSLVDFNFMLTVALVIFPFAFLWSVAMREPSLFLKSGWRSWANHNNGIHNFFVLFITLAFFSEGFNSTSLPIMLQHSLNYVTGLPLLVLVLITVFYFVMAMIGVHPIATLAILIEVLNPLFAVWNPLSIGLVLIVSALSISASSPYGLIATLTAHHLKVNPYRITKANLAFSAMLSGISIIIGYLLL
ncbi:hypothetical protein [Sutcliffiella cohnii]|uniref:hypothetical protein n=1 Tax=Sutcliffiella cohnii TaxID=33932 RepID=UPI002E1FD36A|nr:hypothetical protein [Sutcliffiella cohnii]